MFHGLVFTYQLAIHDVQEFSMLQKRILFSSGLLLSSLLLGSQAEAKPNYPGGQPLIYNNAIGCTSCHSGTPQTEKNANTTYGLLFGNAYDDGRGTLASAYLSLEQWDIDRDGFSNGQELRQTSGYFNSAASTPTLTAPDITAGTVSAKAVDGGAVTSLTNPGTSFANDITSFEKSSVGAPATGTTTTFMYTFGGMQTGAMATFYDENNAIIASTPANTADGSYSTNPISPTDATLDGSMNITVRDEGVFDLYSQAAFIRKAKAKTPAFTPTTIFDAYTGVSPYAQISPAAQVDQYAVIDAYAIIDSYAVIGPYAQIGSYAYVNFSVNGTSPAKAIVDPYVEVTTNISTDGYTHLPNPVGTVSAKFSITTTAPIIPNVTGGGEGGEGSTGGLHCMTTGLGLQGLIFFALFAAGYMLRRKRT
jgi:hypothetical protein